MEINEISEVFYMLSFLLFELDMVNNGCAQSGYAYLILTVSQEWTDEINWFFARWYKSMKAKLSFNYLWMGMVINGHDRLVLETLKSAVS